MARGTIRSPFMSLRKKRFAARAFRRAVEPKCRAPHRRHRRPATTSCAPIDHQTEFIEVARSCTRPAYASIVGRTLCRTAASRGGSLRGETSIPRASHQLGHVPQAHTEAVVEPHAVTDDFRREAITFVERWSGRRLGHGGIRPSRQRPENPVSRTVGSVRRNAWVDNQLKRIDIAGNRCGVSVIGE
jgi:hypothetical protein